MCKYCEDNYEMDVKNIFEIEYKFGQLGAIELAGYIADASIRTEVDAFNHFIGAKKTKINYCPMCGKKLGKE